MEESVSKLHCDAPVEEDLQKAAQDDSVSVKKPRALAIGRGKRLANLTEAKLIAEDFQQSIGAQSTQFVAGQVEDSGWDESADSTASAQPAFSNSKPRNDNRRAAGDRGKFKKDGSGRQWEPKPNFSQQRSKSGFNNNAGRGPFEGQKDVQAVGSGPSTDTRSFGGRKRELDSQSAQHSNSGPSSRQGGGRQQQQHHQQFGRQQDAERDATLPQKARISVFDRLGPKVIDGPGFGGERQPHPSSAGGVRQNEGDGQFGGATARRDRDNFESARNQHAPRFNRGGGARGGSHTDRPMDYGDVQHKVRPLFDSTSSAGSGERDSYSLQGEGGRGNGFDFSNAGRKQTEDFNFGRMDNLPPRFQKNHAAQFSATVGENQADNWQNRRGNDDFKRRKHVPAENNNANQGSNHDGRDSRRVQNRGASLLVKVKNTKSPSGSELTFAENVVEQVELEGSNSNASNASNRGSDVLGDQSSKWMGERTFQPSFGVQDQQSTPYGREFSRGRGGSYRGSSRGQGHGVGYRNQRPANGSRSYTSRVRREGSTASSTSEQTQQQPVEDWSAVDGQDVFEGVPGSAPKQKRAARQPPAKNSATPAESTTAAASNNSSKAAANARDQRKSCDEDDDSEEAMKRFIEENTLRLDMQQFENLTLLDNSVTSPDGSLLKTPVGHEKIIDWAAAVEHENAKYS